MFIAIPLLILGLAAGVYLLIKATKEYLPGIFKGLAWLVIALSLLAIFAIVGRGLRHFNHMRGCEGNCHHEQATTSQMGENHCAMGGACPMGGCKMEGDSVVVEKEACEKMMGKEACEKLCKERGRCILTKSECMEACKGHGGCGMEMGSSKSCAGHEGGASCCKDKAADGATKECCKKKM